VQGGKVSRIASWSFAESVEREGRWDVGGLMDALAPFAPEG
jgi:hypothetical protein